MKKDIAEIKKILSKRESDDRKRLLKQKKMEESAKKKEKSPKTLADEAMPEIIKTIKNAVKKGEPK